MVANTSASGSFIHLTNCTVRESENSTINMLYHHLGIMRQNFAKMVLRYAKVMIGKGLGFAYITHCLHYKAIVSNELLVCFTQA